MVRRIAIWVFGLLAAATAGAVIGGAFDRSAFGSGDTAFAGLVAGVSAFACVRLWCGERR